MLLALSSRFQLTPEPSYRQPASAEQKPRDNIRSPDEITAMPPLSPADHSCTWLLGAAPSACPSPRELKPYPKLAELHRLAQAGAAVPPGLVLSEATALLDIKNKSNPELQSFVEARWSQGPIILRSILPGEDGTQQSASGLALSVGQIRDHHALRRAAQRCLEELQSPALALYFSSPPDPKSLRWLVQHQIVATHWIMAQGGRFEPWYIECFSGSPDPYARGLSPDFAGDPFDWERYWKTHGKTHGQDRSKSDKSSDPKQLAQHLDALQKAFGPAPAMEFELVIDEAQKIWCVQAKALASHPRAAYQSFMQAASPDLQRHPAAFTKGSRWHWDAEHNPESLSAAHRWLIKTLCPGKPEQPPSLLVLAGYLYQRQSTDKVNQTENEPPLLELQRALEDCWSQHLPAARKAWHDFQLGLRPGDLHDLPQKLQQALHSCQEQLDALDRWRRPWNTLHSKGKPARQEPIHPETTPQSSPPIPAGLVAKEEVLDVLPTRWDLAAPSLAQCPGLKAPALAPALAPGLHADRAENPTATSATPGAETVIEDRATQNFIALPQNPQDALRWAQEWDDHWFALALAPLRSLWLWAGSELKLQGDAVFCLSGHELEAASRGQLSQPLMIRLIAQENARQQQWSKLQPPLCILSGQAMPATARGLDRGIAFGASCAGPICHRQDLEQLLKRPPAPDSILAMPALTAQAAVVLHHLGIRAVITEHGGFASHGSHMAQELGLSALVGCRGVTRIPEGTRVCLDTPRGRLIWKEGS